MKKQLSAAILAGAIALACAGPALAISAIPTKAVTVHYNTKIVPQMGVGEYDGQMTLTLNPNGIINGTYIPDSGGPRIVTGGIDANNQVWLDIGFMGHLHVTGTFKNGRKIVGYLFIGTNDYKFVANPKPT